MELKVLLFDRLSVVVAVGAPRLSTPESLLIASRMPEESRGWSSILIVVWVSTAAKWVKWFASRSVEKMRDTVNLMINAQGRELYIARTHNWECCFSSRKFVGCLKLYSCWIFLLTLTLTGSDWAADKTCFRYSMTMQMAVK